MKKILVIILMVFSINVYSQNPNDNIINFSGGAISIANIESKPNKTLGSVYYNDEWQKGNIFLFDGSEIKGYLLKYDIKNQQLEIKIKNDIKILNGAVVKNFSWVDMYGNVEFISNVSNYKGDGSGFYSVIYDGKKTLLKKIGIQIIESNYNTAIDVGNKNSTYSKKMVYYFIDKNKIRKVRKGKKAILRLLEDKKDEIAVFAKDNKLKYSSDIDLKKIFNYYDSL